MHKHSFKFQFGTDWYLHFKCKDSFCGHTYKVNRYFWKDVVLHGESWPRVGTWFYDENRVY